MDKVKLAIQGGEKAIPTWFKGRHNYGIEEKAAVLKRYTDNAEAYQLYLKGRYHWYKSTPESCQKSGDLPKSPLPIIGSPVPSVGARL